MKCKSAACVQGQHISFKAFQACDSMYPQVLENIHAIGISLCMHTGSAATGSERLARLGRLSTGRSDGIEIEMTEIEHEQGSCHSPSAGVLRTSEYAGSREGIFLCNACYVWCCSLPNAASRAKKGSLCILAEYAGSHKGALFLARCNKPTPLCQMLT